MAGVPPHGMLLRYRDDPTKGGAMGAEGPVPEAPVHLAAAEADIAGRAVFAWVLVPAAGRMVHDLANGRDPHSAVEELRTAVRLLDRLGWPDDESGETRLSAEEAAAVRVAARSQMGRGVDPDGAARSRVTRGHAIDLPLPGALEGVLDALERGH